ncbi:MAG: hypothetical protein IPH04_10630 [Saprospirales bacterium]|nr:hypothetical protein [Saprospirales bacterium]
MSLDLPAVDEIHSKKGMQEDKNDIRISVPDLQVDKFQNVPLTFWKAVPANQYRRNGAE